MPHLQFDTDAGPTAAQKEALAATVTDLYTDHMETSPGHVAVTIRDRDPAELHLGRAVEGALVVLDADIREGRPFELKRAFALATMEYLIDEWGVPEANLKATFTAHAGEEMMGYDRVGGDWEE
ncbi:4-oxalocrotonate tautomerase family protein [Halobaculum halobium]|uniref:4-oxalocrotonate tautomerase family protein n=1 Tax=Halobaculum halobium TaxID=3032281 RepID=A0ABD5TAS8_9EURY|nr:tautomerase family protein [Halobaculum sp. SYNS20]